mmetsp:Transcript_82722/g.256940  ORF Transcript_82722/g.256940 Transcript_82722/m.256940 type:complete len:403 (+) Transcript_82722:46-1254(+)
MLAALLLFGLSVGGDGLRQRGASGRRDAKVVGIVAVHPPKFRYLLDFLQQWEGCPQGRDAVDVFAVFSSSEDSAEFEKAWHARSNASSEQRPWEALIAQDLQGKRPSSWKKLDGLAQILDLHHGRGYEFGLLLDSELGVNSCRGFEGLLRRLREKHNAKTWFGDASRLECNTPMRFAACAVAPAAPGQQLWRREAGPERVRCGSAAVLPRLQEQTKNFTVNIWWTDLPYVHMETARRMFDSWAATLVPEAHRKAPPGRGARRRPHSFAELARRSLGALPSPSEVSAKMGRVEGTSQSVKVAGAGFEHMIYQFYTVGNEGFTIHDLAIALPPECGVAASEHFCGLAEADKRRFLEAVRPLWLLAGCPCYASEAGPPLLLFHLDRMVYGHRPYCSPEEAARLGY